MHAVLLDRLEEYLAGTLTPAARQTFETHLTQCESCRQEMDGLKDVAGLFASLRSDETLTPSPAFYSKVMTQVEERRSAPPFSNLFNLDMVFGSVFLPVDHRRFGQFSVHARNPLFQQSFARGGHGPAKPAGVRQRHRPGQYADHADLL